MLTALTYSALSVFGATLTLPGIAGLVLSVAMSIDTNVLIYERIREEQRAGKEARDAIEAGYDRAFLVIIDSHLTTMLTGVILYYVGSGPVKGFGLTLMLGVAISLFSNVYASRLFTDFICRGQRKIGMADLIPEPRLPYVGMRKITYALSIITGLAGLGWFAFGHVAVGGTFQRNFDIEFTGGNLVQVNFQTPLDRAQVEGALEAAHKANPSADSMLDPNSLSEPQAYFSTFGQGGASRQWVFRARDEAGSQIEERRQALSAEQGRLERQLEQARDGGDAARAREITREIEAKVKEVTEQQRLVATRTDTFKKQLAQAFAGSIAAEGDEITAASWNEAGNVLSLTLATLDAPNPTGLQSAATALAKRETLKDVAVTAVGDGAVKVDVTFRQAPTAEPTWLPEDDIARRLVTLLGGGDAARDPARIAVEVYDAAVNALASQRIAIAKPFPASEHFSGQVAGQMKLRALVALLIATIGVLFYIAARFEFGFGVGAVFALVHDVMLTLGLMSLFGVRIDLTVVAALLTIIGYSVNDTIVVFDRIRENLKKMADKTLAEIIDLSVAQTMPRTVLTGGGTILAIIAMILFAGDAVRAFAITLLIGTVLGTYSSVFVASPILLFFSRQKLIAPPPADTGDGEFGPKDSGEDDETEDEPAAAGAPKPV